MAKLLAMKKIISLFLLISSINTYAQISTNGYISNMQMVSITKPDSAWGNVNTAQNRLNFKYNYKNLFSSGIEIRNRLFFGQDVLLNPNYSTNTNNDGGIINASVLVFDYSSAFMISKLERAWVNYNYKKTSITIGRQRINWGQTFVWNPNDIFNSYSFFDLDYEEREGSDAFRFQYFNSSTSRFETAIKADTANNITAALLYAFNYNNTDLQFLAGLYNSNDYVLGASATGNLFNGAIRFESSYFHPKTNFTDSSGIFVASLGYDYMFNKSLFFQSELLFNSNGNVKNLNSDIISITMISPSAKMLSPTQWSFFSMASYPINPITSLSTSFMIFPEIKSAFIGPSFSYSISQNTSLLLTYYLFSDFSNNNLNFIFLRFKWNF